MAKKQKEFERAFGKPNISRIAIGILIAFVFGFIV